MDDEDIKILLDEMRLAGEELEELINKLRPQSDDSLRLTVRELSQLTVISIRLKLCADSPDFCRLRREQLSKNS